MNFIIEHHSSYSYSEPVFLEPHYLYFYPLTRPYQKVLEFDLKITPSPQGLSSRLDAEDNFYHQCWFMEKIDKLDITAVSKIKTTPVNPFNFLVDESRESFQQKALDLFNKPQNQLSTAFRQWLDQLEFNPESNLTGFLLGLGQHISASWQHAIRYGEHLMDPNQCFISRTGSCRDLSWMMIQILRNLGLPSRFVSGYCFNPELTGHELHAWVETWLTGAGWVGIDPSAGVFVTSEYFPVSSSYHPSHTLPVQGTYRGDATSKLETTVNIMVD